MGRSKTSRLRSTLPKIPARCGWTGKRRALRWKSPRKSNSELMLYARFRLRAMLFGMNDGAEDTAAPDDVYARARLDVEDQETAAIFDELGPRHDRCAGSDGL